MLALLPEDFHLMRLSAFYYDWILTSEQKSWRAEYDERSTSRIIVNQTERVSHKTDG